ncbi:MAG: hypothetical protein GX957_08240 [Clostridiaceae bacterium]|nr:hypothetical protein [Clostridiaceae bacterium]
MDKKTLKAKTSQSRPKKKLIRTKREIRRNRWISTIAILLVAAIVFFVIDSRSYVATVAGNRISKAEFKFFLRQQVTYTEYEEGLNTDEEKEKFWTTPADGQDPWEEAKIKALDLAKEYAVQLIKAKEAGLKVDKDIKAEVLYLLTSMQNQMTNKQFINYIEAMYDISPKQLQHIWENYRLIDKFKAGYIDENYKPDPIEEDQIKEYYDENRNPFDKVDISYLAFYKYDQESFEDLSEEEISKKHDLANQALEKIKSGENIDKVIEEYSEQKDDTSENSEQESPKGKTTLQYNEGNSLAKWAFDNTVGAADIIDTDYVIYVAKIENRTDFDDVRENVKAEMENEAREEFYDSVLDEWSLESKYNIIKNDSVYDSISYKN